MKKKLLILTPVLVIVLAFMAITANAETVASGTCGENLTWELDDAGTLTISGDADMNNYSSLYDAPWFSNGYLIKNVVVESGVKSIANHAFQSCNQLISVTIPDSVVSIGYEAFCDCSSLVNINIPYSVISIGVRAFYNTGYYNNSINWENGVLYIDNCIIEVDGSISSFYEIKEGTRQIANNAFYGCPNLTNVNIPDGVISIGELAFSGCTGLTSVTIPDSVTSIGFHAFSSCDNLTSVYVSENNKQYSSLNGVIFNKDKTTIIYYPSGKIGEYIIPDSVEKIGEGAFSNCTGLTSITITDGVTSIGDSAFSCCESLTSLIIPNTVTSIGNAAFECCVGLTNITIGNNVNSIGDFAFDWCVGLTSISIPSSVTSIGKQALAFCLGLTSIDIPEGTTSIGERVFSCCTNLVNVTIPKTITVIGDYAFEGCNSLKCITVDDENQHYSSLNGVLFDKNKTIIIRYPAGICGEYVVPNGVRNIGSEAFYGCEGLIGIIMSDSVTTVGDNAFAYCHNLKKLIISNSVTHIYDSAFWCCCVLENVTVGKGIELIGDYAFEECGNLTNVFYKGTEEQWDNISKGCSNEEILNAVINFEDVSKPRLNVGLGISGEDKAFTVDCFALKKGDTILVALYKNDRFLELFSATYIGEQEEYRTKIDFDYAKVMAFESLESIKPLCNCVIVTN